jgi:hypothetical protein
MMTSGELIGLNKIAVLENRMQRIERQLDHCVKINENLRSRVTRLSSMLIEITEKVLPLLENVQEEKLPTLAEACFVHSLQR